MPGLLVRWLITTLAIMLIPQIVSGVEVKGIGAAIAAAALVGVLNALVRPVLVLLTLPLTILTLGLFILVINAIIFQIAGAIVPGVAISSFWAAFKGSLVVSVVSWIMNFSVGSEADGFTVIVKDRPHRGRRVRRYESQGNTIDLTKKNDDKWE
jgi:putative membrane protein